MDINTLMNQSPQVMTVIENIKNDPNFLSELKANPQETLSKLGIELNEQELGFVQKLGGFSEIEEEAEAFFTKVKGLFGSTDDPKDPN